MSAFLDLYFERIGYSGSPGVNLQTLRELHLAHLKRIPYENIDVFSLQGVDLDPETVARKVLLRRRGGYCFVQNGLFLRVLTELGFRSHANMARVHRNRPEPGGRTHHINLVELEGQTWVCDVGFGGSGFREPLRLEPDLEVDQLGEVYRLHPSDVHGFYLQRRRGAAWEPLYTFKVEPALPIDIAMANFYTSRSPDHVFLDAIMGTRMTDTGRVTLSNHTFKVFDLTRGTQERETVTDFDAYLDRLDRYLGVRLDETEQALFKPRFATLKLTES